MLKQSRFFSFVIISMLLVLLGCSTTDSSNPDDSSTLDGQTYSIISDTGLLSDGDIVSGNGSIIFNNPLPSISSNRSYYISFSLEDDGELVLYSHSINTLEDAISVVFTRNDSTLTVSLVKGSTTEDISDAFSNVSADESITLQIDIHNEEVPSHILVWNGSDYSEEEAIVNTENNFDSPGNGEGTFWGLGLTNASVSDAVVSSPKFTED